MRNLKACHDRIMARTSPSPDGCTLCTYSTGSHGYSQAWDGVTVVLAHRIVWEYHHGPVPADLTVDHRCHVRTCVNIDHLRLLPNGSNAADNGQTPTNPPTAKECPTCSTPMVQRPGATYRPYCRPCQNRRRRARRASGKAN